MVIVSKTILNSFGLAHTNAKSAIEEWYKIAKDTDWGSLSDIKQSFNSVDYVGNDRYVFNIKGNNYRLIAMIFFDKRTLFIRFIGTHAEYNKIDASII